MVCMPHEGKISTHLVCIRDSISSWIAVNNRAKTSASFKSYWSSYCVLQDISRINAVIHSQQPQADSSDTQCSSTRSLMPDKILWRKADEADWQTNCLADYSKSIHSYHALLQKPMKKAACKGSSQIFVWRQWLKFMSLFPVTPTSVSHEWKKKLW